MSKQERETLNIQKTENLLHLTENKVLYVDQELRALSVTKDMIFHPEKVTKEAKDSVHDLVKNISTRNFGVMPYHHETEKYNDSPNDSAEIISKKRIYRQEILRVAQDLGFLGKKILEPNDDFGKRLGFLSNPEIYDGEVEAIVVPGAAALSNYKRFYHAVKSISTDAIKTDTIIFAACERQTEPNEQKTMAKQGFSCGQTEFELGLQAVKDIAGGFINGTEKNEENKVIFSGVEYPVKITSGEIFVNNKKINVKVIESPYDKTRKLEDGSFTSRANTEEIFASAMTVLDKNMSDKTICITSHDIWKPSQHVAAELIFSGHSERKIISSGPDNCDRLYINELGKLDIKFAEAVVDEMSKYLYELDKLRKFLTAT